MKISGSGHIPAAEYYEDISISGSGKIDGNVRCNAFSCSGSASSEGDVYCSDIAKISGSSHFKKNLHAKDVSVSGSLSVDGDCSADNKVKISGSFKCGGNIRCTSIKVSGVMELTGGVEAEDADISGIIKCGGLLNAEKIYIRFDHSTNYVGSIGGSDIKIICEKKRPVNRLPLFSKLAGGSGFLVNESIEGDVIAIEDVCSPLVIGRVVAIGAGCQIELVQYSDEIEIHPDAKVTRYEKI